MSSYTGNRNTKKYHKSNTTNDNCQLGEIKDRVHFSTKHDAEAAGYKPCDYCLP